LNNQLFKIRYPNKEYPFPLADPSVSKIMELVVTHTHISGMGHYLSSGYFLLARGNVGGC
jgi:hypothetical protein